MEYLKIPYMKNLVKNITPNSLRNFLIRLGRFYSLENQRKNSFHQFPSQKGAFCTLKELGWNPQRCIDVGAYNGEWTRMFISIFPDAKVLMIEAQEGKKEILKNAISAIKKNNLEFEICLVGANDGKEVSFIEMGTGSSVYEESSYYKRTKTNKKLIRLDTLLENYPDFIASNALKIDTQGYELEVLKGCPLLLKNLEVVLLEVSLVEINKRTPLFSEVVSFMACSGFKLFDFCSQIRRKDGVLWQTDLMWIRDDGKIEIPAELNEQNWG